MQRKTALIIALLSGIIIAGVAVQQKTATHVFRDPAGATIVKADYSPEWRVVDSLVNEGLTESAQNAADSLYAKAKKEDAATQQVKALLYRMRLDSYKEEQAVVKALNRLESDASAAKEPLRSILHSITAEVYWRYYEQNRWRFYDRTKTVNFKQDDITTWDLSKIVETVLHHYELSLADRTMLQRYPLQRIQRHPSDH